jgi:hypothetical protein
MFVILLIITIFCNTKADINCNKRHLNCSEIFSKFANNFTDINNEFINLFNNSEVYINGSCSNIRLKRSNGHYYIDSMFQYLSKLNTKSTELDSFRSCTQNIVTNMLHEMQYDEPSIQSLLTNIQSSTSTTERPNM